VEKYATTGHSTDDSMWRTRFAFWITKATVFIFSKHQALVAFEGGDVDVKLHTCSKSILQMQIYGHFQRDVIIGRIR